MHHSRHSSTLTLVLMIAIAAFLAYKARQSSFAPALPSGTASRIGPPDIYPNPALTPGAVDPEITQDNLADTICNPTWSTRSIRPPERYTSRLKFQQLRQYGYSDTDPRDYEEDHLIPLELGGHPSDPHNLWPEPYSASIPDGGAHAKDRVENYLHDQVCSGAVPLADAQRAIASDWFRVYSSRLAP
jgi:hypothetical protein